MLRRVGDQYQIHAVPVDDAEQALRSILDADQSAESELARAVIETRTKPVRPKCGTARKRKRKRNR